MNVRDNQAHYKRINTYLLELNRLYMDIVRKSANMVQGLEVDGVFHYKDYPELNYKVEKLFEELGGKMNVVIRGAVVDEWEQAQRVSDKLVEKFSKKAGIPPASVRGYGERNIEALDSFIESKTKGLKLSDRVWKYTNQFKSELELGLSLGIGEGKSADEMSRDIRRYLREPERLYRRVRNEYGELVLSKNAKMYRSGQGVYRSSYKNAMRLARTEINKSYRLADYERRKSLSFVVGIEVRRSNHDYGCPVCESLKGRYPKDFIFTGWHPNCRCHTVSILSTESEFIEQQKAILEGREAESKSKNAVESVPTNFSKWLQENRERIDNAKSKPYWMMDNKKYVQK